MGRLERHLDIDLIARVLNKTPRPVPPVTRVKPARAAETYRAARRNAARECVWGPERHYAKHRANYLRPFGTGWPFTQENRSPKWLGKPRITLRTAA